MSRDIERQKAKTLKVMDARDLIKAKFSAILPHLTAAQIDQVQRQLDAYLINEDVDRQLEELNRKSIIGRTPGGQPVHDESKRVSPDTLMKVKKNKIDIKEADTVIRLDFEKLLAADALKPTSDNPDEAAYLLMVRAALATQGVWFRVFRNNSQMARTQYTAPNDHRAWFAMLWFGGDRRNEIQTDTGQLTRKALLSVPRLAAGYYDYVYNGPTLRLLKAAVDSVSSKVRVMVALHHDYSPKSVRGKALDWYLRERIGKGVLGVSVELPDEKIWDEPAQLLTKALHLINHGKLNEANKLVILASYQAEWGANALMQYIKFVEAVKPGVSVVLQVLQVAKKLGEIADAILLIRSAGKGLFRLLSGKGAPPAIPAPGTGSPSRQIAAPASNPVDSYQTAIKKAENAVQPATRNAPTAPSVAPRSGNGPITRADSVAPGPPGQRINEWDLLPLNSDARKRALEWLSSTGNAAYTRANAQYVEYVRRELRHLEKVKPHYTMADKNAIIDRADKMWWSQENVARYTNARGGFNVDVK